MATPAQPSTDADLKIAESLAADVTIRRRVRRKKTADSINAAPSTFGVASHNSSFSGEARISALNGAALNGAALNGAALNESSVRRRVRRGELSRGQSEPNYSRALRKNGSGGHTGTSPSSSAAAAPPGVA